MLSKSAAKAFFIVGTGLFSLIFLGLTVDTVRQAPERTNSAKLTPQVARGKDLWDRNNCMGCHTLLGEGAYYAPELTKVYERRGEAWIKVFLKDPQAMFPGRRKMIQYDFTDQEMDELIAFFKWIGEMDLNGFPKKPPLADELSAASSGMGKSQGDSNPLSLIASSPKVFQDLCLACHKLDGTGGTIGPALDTVGTRMSQDEMRIWLKNPSAVKPGTTMPNLMLSENQIEELVQFLDQRR